MGEYPERNSAITGVYSVEGRSATGDAQYLVAEGHDGAVEDAGLG